MADQKILDRLAKSVESLAELRVVTAVGDIQIRVKISDNGADVRAHPNENAQGVPGLFTEVNLITGDIVNLINKDFEGKENPITQFHGEQVSNGRQIVADNVNTIITLIKDAGATLQEVLDKPARKPEEPGG